MEAYFFNISVVAKSGVKNTTCPIATLFHRQDLLHSHVECCRTGFRFEFRDIFNKTLFKTNPFGSRHWTVCSERLKPSTNELPSLQGLEHYQHPKWLSWALFNRRWQTIIITIKFLLPFWVWYKSVPSISEVLNQNLLKTCLKRLYPQLQNLDPCNHLTTP